MAIILHRDILDIATIGKITQGTIFSGGYSYLYEDYEVWGVIITPRCDIAQNKVSIYFYLPVVRWDDFMIREVYSMLTAHKCEEWYKKLVNKLTNNRISTSIMTGYLTEEEVHKLFHPGDKQSKTLADLETQFNEWRLLSQSVEKFNNAKTGAEIKEIWSDVKPICEANMKSYVDTLVKNNNPDYYIIEHPAENLLVIRLREIQRMSNTFLNKLKSGIEIPFVPENPEITKIGKVKEGIYMPLYEIKSPYIEHLMQRFMAQFNRIGVADFNTEILNGIL